MDQYLAYGSLSGGNLFPEGPETRGHSPYASDSTDLPEIKDAVEQAASELEEILTVSLVPEVGINIGYALPEAKTPSDVYAMEGRLIRVGNAIGHIGGARPGASKHIARIILAAMKFDGNARSAMNIRFDERAIEICESLGYLVGSFDRKDEPEKTSTMEWGCEFVIKALGKVPDIIYDMGGIRKEPMIRILGKNPQDVVDKLRSIVNRLE